MPGTGEARETMVKKMRHKVSKFARNHQPPISLLIILQNDYHLPRDNRFAQIYEIITNTDTFTSKK